MAKKTIGMRSSQWISAYSRRIGRGRASSGRFFSRKTTVKAHTRFNRWWGKAEPIPAKPILKYERKVIFPIGKLPKGLTIPENVKRILPKNPIDAKLELEDYYHEIEKSIGKGIDLGIKEYIRRESIYIPSNSNKLRTDVINSLYNHRKTLPIVVSIGAPHTKHASVVQAYTPDKVQIQHSTGKQMSGVGNQFAIGSNSKNPYPYYVKNGDPKAQYHFFSYAVMNSRTNIKEGVMKQLNIDNIPVSVFNWLIKITERVIP